jgi:hypothetical protein
VVVHLDEAAAIDLEPHVAGTEPIRVRHAPDGDHEPVALELLREALVVGVLDDDAVLARATFSIFTPSLMRGPASS